MDKSSIKKVIDEHYDMIAVNAKSIAGAQSRMGKFLMVVCVLSAYILELEIAWSKSKTLMEAQYAMAVQNGEGKTITEKKLSASLNKTYCDARETYEVLEANRAMLKAHLRVFENAHIMYRQISNTES